ncbi:hypothetical protein IDSA_07060 [Pseudidiomarina salinarum]|uniref:Uncharacterized protein n=1 Tax=Pseudidiomarina salinarum TaxID=435908 RepID=A0A094IUP7_9GAMM|nr:hypothetical protein [Pseudidiomarina salinarum]KFZ30837.1 hypothetical protein IDSA_07060 [Pseudidiomarina salinarum]RUO71307.1 hypothetical protein CWI79_07745 [Pseudidiomarina salinarum]
MIRLLDNWFFRFIKDTVIWLLIFLGLAHFITIAAMVLDWENQRDFTLDEHIRFTVAGFFYALLFSSVDALKRLFIRMKKNEK